MAAIQAARPGFMRPLGRVRRDALPEGYGYSDDGCEVATRLGVCPVVPLSHSSLMAGNEQRLDQIEATIEAGK